MKKIEILNKGKTNYKLDSKTINQVLEFVLKLDKNKLFLLEEIEDIFLNEIDNIFKRLSNGYPLSYVTKNVNFTGYDFYVDENVLIPRDDTQVIVGQVKSYLDSKMDKYTLLDLGTGSGIIGITSYLQNMSKLDKVVLIDLSNNALEVARHNLSKFNIDSIETINIDFRQFDFLKFEGKRLLLTANLPYIKKGDFENMDFGVYIFEPELALYGGEKTGFELYEDLINILNSIKERFESIVLYIEIGFDQYEISNNFLSNLGLKFEYFKDTNNINRVVTINF